MSATTTLPAPAVVGQRAPVRWRDLRRSVKICVLAFVGLLVVGILELGSRYYWKKVKKVAAFSPEAVFRTFYPEMNKSGLDAVAPYHGDDTFDVLLLGGSVLYPSFSDIGTRLQQGLEAKLGRTVRVVNLASVGLTSRDSLNKYARMTDKRFDLVFVYNGINDVMLNNTPPSAFKADYTHHTRFAQVAAIDRHRELRYLAFPYTAYYWTTCLLDRMHVTNRPRAEFIPYGKDIRTPPSFEANEEAMILIAKQRGERIVLMTFASHIPANYTDEAFAAKQLDYTDHAMSVRTWGEAENVRNTLALHNDAIRRIAARHPEVLLIDQAERIPKEGRCFTDPCHLTKQGAALFVENVLADLAVEKLKN